MTKRKARNGKITWTPDSVGLRIVLHQTPLAVTFAEHYRAWHGCTRCKIGELACHHVFGRGDLPCDVLFLGEGPGMDEDTGGSPFVGKSGKLLDKALAIAHTVGSGFREYSGSSGGLDIRGPMCDRWTYYITNTVLCRPTDRLGGPNRQPTDVETDNCREQVWSQVIMGNPRCVVLLGRVAELWWRSEVALAKMPAQYFNHPSFIIRSGGEKSAHFKPWAEEMGHYIVKRLQQGGNLNAYLST